MDSNIAYGFTSELSLAETLAKPVADGNSVLEETYEQTIQTSAVLQVVPISREILIASARLRSKSIRLPDAINLFVLSID